MTQDQKITRYCLSVGLGVASRLCRAGRRRTPDCVSSGGAVFTEATPYSRPYAEAPEAGCHRGDCARGGRRRSASFRALLGTCNRVFA